MQHQVAVLRLQVLADDLVYLAPPDISHQHVLLA